MREYIMNLHIHSVYSDGTGTHADIVSAAQRASLDIVVVTDHNVLVQGLEGYYGEGDRQLLLLTGEEVHDQTRDPQKNHMLVLGAGREVAQFAADPQILIDKIRSAGGLSFLAHPFDPEAALFPGTDISWVNWEVHGYTGIELWNALAEFKSVATNWPSTVFHAYQPARVNRYPYPQTLAKWDELLSQGNRVVALGGSDAHARTYSLGPLRRVIFPYEVHFRGVNTHLLVDKPLSGNFEQDKRTIYATLATGRAFVGYDLPSPTQGFRFWAKGAGVEAVMGEEISLGSGVTLSGRLPLPAHCRIIHNGAVVLEENKETSIRFGAKQPGAYRLEAYLPFNGRLRGWIFSNPIYLLE